MRADKRLALHAFDVTYEIITLITMEQVSTGATTVLAPRRALARAQALEWVHDNDVRADPRIDPVVRILTCALAPSAKLIAGRIARAKELADQA